ncbi:hypothetical protein [Proteiniclasticum ruminis]|uniref:Nuclease-related domain-containing protein n=1 Tax=Proteiniclasticum ruminis TaxID=398199 RepID=A0A1G8GIX0_9CLOT|nr:hypothetical protein [Proteiniclasticum ruminis]SDH94334.1 hypothetical protein SAMN05421804_101282 [Proteiniclasticum ruminis]
MYEKYNNFGQKDNSTISDIAALKMLQEVLFPYGNISDKFRKYNQLCMSKQQLTGDETFQNYPLIKEIPQPKSIFLRFIYIDLVIKSIPDDYFESLKMNRTDLSQLVLSISLYALFLQTYAFSNLKITNSQKKWLLGSEDFYFRLDDLQRVCGKITLKSYNIFLDLFAYNLDMHEYPEPEIKKLYSKKGNLFILSIEEFLDYMLFQIESLYRTSCKDGEFSQYQQRKSLAFENLAYSLLQTEFSDTGHGMYYYPPNKKKIETDIITKTDKELIIFECKSGTIDLRRASTDKEITMKVRNLVKKAYVSLEAVANYIQESNQYYFSNNQQTIIGKSDIDNTLCVHLSMYPIDFIASNIHVLNDEYLGKINKPKITMSFEHLASIIIDLQNNKNSLSNYLRIRQTAILNNSQKSFDVNELDLYNQLMDIDGKSILNEIINTDFLKKVNSNATTITTFRNCRGKEYRPSTYMIQNLDRVLLSSILKNGKNLFNLNKRFLRYFEEYLIVY